MKKSAASHNAKKRRMRKKRLPPGVPNPVDIHVGGRVRQRRRVLGLSQEKLGDAVGLTFQQIQKYEKGINGVSSVRLLQLSNYLKIHCLSRLSHHEYEFSALYLKKRAPEDG